MSDILAPETIVHNIKLEQGIPYENQKHIHKEGYHTNYGEQFYEHYKIVDAPRKFNQIPYVYAPDTHFRYHPEIEEEIARKSALKVAKESADNVVVVGSKIKKPIKVAEFTQPSSFSPVQQKLLDDLNKRVIEMKSQGIPETVIGEFYTKEYVKILNPEQPTAVGEDGKVVENDDMNLLLNQDWKNEDFIKTELPSQNIIDFISENYTNQQVQDGLKEAIPIASKSGENPYQVLYNIFVNRNIPALKNKHISEKAPSQTEISKAKQVLRSQGVLRMTQDLINKAVEQLRSQETNLEFVMANGQLLNQEQKQNLIQRTTDRQAMMKSIKKDVVDAKVAEEKQLQNEIDSRDPRRVRDIENASKLLQDEILNNMTKYYSLNGQLDIKLNKYTAEKDKINKRIDEIDKEEEKLKKSKKELPDAVVEEYNNLIDKRVEMKEKIQDTENEIKILEPICKGDASTTFILKNLQNICNATIVAVKMTSNKKSISEADVNNIYDQIVRTLELYGEKKHSFTTTYKNKMKAFIMFCFKYTSVVNYSINI